MRSPRPFNRNGGQILSFIGTASSAFIPAAAQEPSEMASREAFAAVGAATARMAALNAERRTQGRDPIGYGIRLHVGTSCSACRPAATG